MPTTKRDKQIIFFTSQSMCDEIDVVCKREGIARADFVRGAVREALHADNIKEAERIELLLKIKADKEKLEGSQSVERAPLQSA